MTTRSKWVFLSHSLSADTPVYGNRHPFKIIESNEIHAECAARSQTWLMNNHTGTHVDFPAHFIPEGRTFSDYPAGDFVFDRVALVAAKVPKDLLIQFKDLGLKGVKPTTELLLIRTGFEKKRRRDPQKYVLEGPGIHPECARALIKKFPKLRAIGFDFISLNSYTARELGREAHRVLLGAGKKAPWILEDLSLATLKRAPQQVVVGVLPVSRADGAPAMILARM